VTIHSIIPDEVIFHNAEDSDYRFTDVAVDGIPMQVQFFGEAVAKIIRLYSANPNDYLNPKYAPGTVVRFAPATRS
jgi:hypothetical protein